MTPEEGFTIQSNDSLTRRETKKELINVVAATFKSIRQEKGRVEVPDLVDAFMANYDIWKKNRSEDNCIVVSLYRNGLQDTIREYWGDEGPVSYSIMSSSESAIIERLGDMIGDYIPEALNEILEDM